MPRSRRPSRSRSTTGSCGSPTPTASTSPRAARPSSTWSSTTSRVGPGIVNALRRAAVHAAPVPEGAGRQEGAPEAAAGRRARLGRDRAAALPALEPHRRRAVRDRARVGDLGGADVDGRVPPVEQPARRHREARRVAHRPRPRPHECDYAHGAAGRRTWSTRSSTSSARSASRRPPAARGCTSTCGSSPDHGFKDVRRAALAFAREIERRTPDDVTTTWWRKDRDPHQLFVDYNQNARDHTIAAAYSVRGVPDARVSTPIGWDEVDDADPHDFTIFTVPGAVRRARRPARGHRRPRLRHRAAAGVGRPRRGRRPHVHHRERRTSRPTRRSA